MKAIIEGVEVNGTPLEIIQYKNMIEAQKNSVKQTHYLVHFPAGHIPSPSDASIYGKILGAEIRKMYGNEHYQ